MGYTVKQLQQLSDDALIAEHDRLADNTTVGVSYYLDEMRRRETAAQMKSAYRISIAATLLGAVGTIAAVVALFVR